MKNQVSITVKKPCAEKFESFMKTDKGGFCNSCEKEVIDFTAMSSSELIDYLFKKNTNPCGRFKTSQLGTIQELNAQNHSFNFLSSGVAAISFSLLALHHSHFSIMPYSSSRIFSSGSMMRCV